MEKPRPGSAPLAELEPNQPFGRLLTGRDTSDMLKYAVRLPVHNQHLIQSEGLQKLQIVKDDGAKALGAIDVLIDHNLIDIPARFLPVPQIVYIKKAGGPDQAHPELASWDIPNDAKFYRVTSTSAKLPFTFAVIDFRQENRFQEGESNGATIVSKLTKWLESRGFTMGQVSAPVYCDFFREKDREANFTKALRQFRDAAVKLIVLQAQDTQVYADVKRIADREGAITMCVASRKLKGQFNLTEAVKDGLAMKMNFKTGGMNHGLIKGVLLSDGKKLTATNPQKAFAAIMNDTMVMGADVVHPSGGAISGCPSIAAVVANSDLQVSNFPGSVRIQSGRQEVIDDVGAMAKERLKLWEKVQNRLPTRIIYYRDGVSESQYQEVLSREGRAISKAYDALKQGTQQASNDLKLVFIVCGKRHNARFFAKKQDDTYPANLPSFQDPQKKERRPNGNVRPGLVVDRVISRPQKDPSDKIFDFYLQSHVALQGTAHPCHYVVLQNDFLTTDQIQELTHAFCYNYAKATNGISQASPAYYADRLCTRASLYLHKYFTGQALRTPQLGQGRLQGDGGGPYSDDWPEFRREVASWVQRQPEWLPTATDRAVPWAKEMDEIMFSF